MLTGGANVNRFPARIPTPGGGQIGYAPADAAGVTSKCYFDPESTGLDAADNKIIATPSTGDVGTTTGTPTTSHDERRMGIEATFEPDADLDGWGDESQDRCPGSAGDNQGCPIIAAVLPPPPPPDTTKPAVVALKFSRSTFAAAKSGAAFTAQKGKKKRKKPSAPVGTKVSFGLSEAASVKFTVERKTSGRSVSAANARPAPAATARSPSATCGRRSPARSPSPASPERTRSRSAGASAARR